MENTGRNTRRLRGKFCILQQPSERYGRDGAASCETLGQCQACRDYQAGKFKNRFPVPAIPETVGWTKDKDGNVSLVRITEINKTHWRVK